MMEKPLQPVAILRPEAQVLWDDGSLTPIQYWFHDHIVAFRPRRNVAHDARPVAGRPKLRRQSQMLALAKYVRPAAVEGLISVRTNLHPTLGSQNTPYTDELQRAPCDGQCTDDPSEPG